MKHEPSPTVYSWYTPEVARVVNDLAQEYPTELYRQNYEPGLDELHDNLMDLYQAHSVSEVFNDESPVWDNELPHRYYTNGSSEGIFHLLARHATYFPQVPLYQFGGEYQGYGEYAKALGLEFFDISFGMDPKALRPGVFFISVPSAVDGNIIHNAEIQRICGANHYVIIDLAYAGMATYSVDSKLLLDEHIAAVVGSMSKPFGLYYHRIGFLWARDPVPSLYGNRWFKNVFSIEVGKEVFANYTAYDLAKKYRNWQSRACQEASEHFECRIRPSDVWLLGHLYPGTEGVPESLNPFKRGPGYRFCLTPYYMAYEREEQ